MTGDYERRLLHARIDVLATQARAGAMAGLVASATYSVIFVDVMGWTAYGAWAACLLAVHVVRGRFLRQLAGKPDPDERDQFYIGATAVALGVVINAPTPFILPLMDPVMQGVWVAMAVSWVAVAAMMIGVLPRTYALYVLICYALQAIAWALVLPPVAAAAATVMLAVGGLVLVQFSYRIAAVFEESFRIRTENAALVIELGQTVEEREAAYRSRAELIAQSTHDMLQPVAALDMFADVLAVSKSPTVREEALQNLRWSVESIKSMFRGLLEQARLDARTVEPRPSQVVLFALLRPIVDAYRRVLASKGVELVLECDPAIAVRTDATLLERLIRNVVDNAAKFTDSGRVEVRVAVQDGRVEVRVLDTGIGIPEADMDQLCNPFFRSDNARMSGVDGLGLGLSVAGRMADLLDIDLQFSRREPSGTAVTLRLPADPADSASAAGAPASALPRIARRIRVLVVEDDRRARDALRLWLAEQGCDVRAAAHLSDAIEVCHTDAFVPRVLISDLNLGPGEPNGFEVVAYFRSAFGDIQAAVVTGEPYEPEALDRSVRVLKKPAEHGHLRELLAAAGEP